MPRTKIAIATPFKEQERDSLKNIQDFAQTNRLIVLWLTL
jgi:hypothetical protein